jgi:tetratricopeptide (TPR) repeat protein
LGSLWVSFGILLTSGIIASAAELAEVRKQFRAGKYADCAQTVADEIAKGADTADWWVLKARAEVAQGQYDAAVKTLEDARTRFPSDLSVHLLAVEVYRTSGREKELTLSEDVIRRIEKRFVTSAEERIALGRYLLARGTDAKEVLDQFFNPVLKKTPDHLDARYAVTELALGKNDRAFASDTLLAAPKEAAQDPYYYYLIARTFAVDDRERSQKAVADAFAINPRHVDSLLYRADYLIHAEEYPAAEADLKTVLEVDPGEPRAWALRAVLAHLRSDAEGEKAARETALTRWPMNPEVDHLIGRKLSQDYRFKEGAEYQRKALEKNQSYLPAKAQLCQDLLRLGEDAEGWKLAAEVFATDSYDVVAHNLVTLRDQLNNYRTLAADGFLLRMEAKEAELYGAQALALLRRAKKTLTAKYDVKLDRAVTVEIFPRKQDFAVRTFGMPGAEGFLGVCFGPVITVNSPASQGQDPSNWEAVLWHEFCHTVTLHKTRNKMPRWLSEGISVYEEIQENPAWGQWLNPRYREMVLSDDFTPMSRMTSAFLNPKSALHVQFAYLESAWAVEFLIRKHGFDALKEILNDLGKGVTINDAIERRTGMPMAKVDQVFTEFSRERARSVAAEATWEKPDLPDSADAPTIRAWLEKHPKNFWGIQKLGVRLIRDQNWTDAEKVASELRSLYPEYVGPDNAYEMLATVYQKTGKPAEEAAALEEWAKREGDAIPAYQRLVELGEKASDWAAVARNTRRWLAVNPLTPAPHRALAKAAEQLKDRGVAIAEYRSVLQLQVPDAADVRYRLAVVLEQDGQRDLARREVLKALEDAPRSRDAHALLLKLIDPEKKR